MNDILGLCDEIRKTSYDIHRYHGNGFLEQVYENALTNRLRRRGYRVDQQRQISIFDEDGTNIGDYFADLLVEDCLMIELKACKMLANEHRAQLFHYLKAAGMEHGLLINFGSYRFQIQKLVKSQGVNV